MESFTQGQSLPIWSSIWRRLRNRFRTIFTRGDLSALVIACALLFIPVLALDTSLDITKELAKQTATWQVGLNQLIPIAVFSVIIGFLLSRSHYSELFCLILSGIWCIVTMALVQFFAAPGDPVTRIIEVTRRFATSLQTSLTNNTLDPYILILFLSVLIWFLGHNTAWHTFRLDRVWRAVLPPGIVLVLNAFYNVDPSKSNIEPYLFIYVFLALLLVIRSHIEAREFDWYMNRVAFQGNLKSLRAWLFRSGAILALLLLVVAWLLPTGNPEDNAKRFEQFMQGDKIRNLNQLLEKLLGPIGSGAPSADYYGGDTLSLTGAVKLGDQVVMVVTAPPTLRYYWQSRVFDTYENNSWSSPRAYQLSSDGPGLEIKYPPTNPDLRQDVDQHVTIAVGVSRLVYGAPQPVKFGLPVEVEMDYVDAASKTINPSVTRPKTTLNEGDSYDITSSVSIASADTLRTQSTTYPQWVRSLDLQLPPIISTRTRNLALQIVQQAQAKTVYDKAKAIELWLRDNIRYNENIVTPPANRELVDWLLFDQHEGYCTYYASAMIVMLRSMGIPARMGAGFAQGVLDASTGSYVVRERDAHTWVEVYFPEAGWVEFEPTSAQQQLDRPDPNQKTTQVAPPQPTNTPSPTPSPSPTPQPTASQAGAGAPAVSPTSPPQGGATQPVTVTPPEASTATATTVPIKVIDLPPTVQTGFTALLILAVMVAVLSFVAVGLLWWIEYRGLDRLSPIGRAYARLAIYAGWLGIPLDKTNTPLERGRKIAKEVPAGNRPVTAITDMYINERYSRPRTMTPDEEDSAQDSWRHARRAFIIRRIRRLFGRE